MAPYNHTQVHLPSSRYPCSTVCRRYIHDVIFPGPVRREGGGVSGQQSAAAAARPPVRRHIRRVQTAPSGPRRGDRWVYEYAEQSETVCVCVSAERRSRLGAVAV